MRILFFSLLIFAFSLPSEAQYSSANQHSEDNTESNNYQSGYVNDYGEKAKFVKPQPKSTSGFENNYNYYDEKQREVEQIIPRRNPDPNSRDNRKNSKKIDRKSAPVI